MNTSMITASVTMGQLQQKLDTISNNIANSNTTGFKRRESTFSDLLVQQVNNQPNAREEIGRLTPYGLRVGSGAKIAQTSLILLQGPLQTTDRELDFALTEKDQFFRIETFENGGPVERLTRAGAFYLTEDPANEQQLSIVTDSGNFVLDANGNRLSIPFDFESIGLSSGELVITMRDGTEVSAGEIGITRVLKPQLLHSVGGNMYQIPNVEQLGYNPADVFEQVPLNERAITQGALEGSNVDVSREMTELITAQRHFQFNSRSISIADEMAGLVNGIRR